MKTKILLLIVLGVALLGTTTSRSQSTAPLEYTALLNQLDTDDPTVTVLKNTLGGEIVWTRWSAGYHYGYLSGAFPGGRVVCRKPSVDTDAAQHEEYDAWLMRGNDDQVTLIIKNAAGEYVDSAANLPIEILVYPEP